MALENENGTSAHVTSLVPSATVGEVPSSTIAKAADTIQDLNAATNEAKMILLCEIIPFLQTLGWDLKIARLGSTTSGVHKVDNPLATAKVLLEALEVLGKNNWTVHDPTVNTRLKLMDFHEDDVVDFKSGLNDPMSYPDSLNGLAEELSQGTIDSEDIRNYREFLLLLAGDLLAI